MKGYLVSVQPILPGGDTQVLETFFKPTNRIKTSTSKPKK